MGFRCCRNMDTYDITLCDNFFLCSHSHAGNKPYYTEITPLIIMSELQEFDYSSATAIALVMLAVSFFILFLNSMIQQRNARILRGGNA